MRRRRTIPDVLTVVAFDQDEKRSRRRQHLVVAYDGTFSLADEIDAICGPLARRIAALPNSSIFRVPVTAMADAVHEAASTVVGWLAQIDARQRTEHLAAEPAKRVHAIRLIVDLAQRPTLPEITATNLMSGRWSSALVSMSDEISVPLAALLNRAHPPGDDRLRGQPSRSDQLVDLLRGTIDRAARDLGRKVDWAESNYLPQTPAPQADPVEELRSLGVVL